MIISIASGKGGTGKTTVAVALAKSFLQRIQLLDCDVEEPNTHIFIKPKIDCKVAANVLVPTIAMDKCTLCGKCADICAFNALAITNNKTLVFAELCHSCGACQYLCPQQAISEIAKEIGTISIGQKEHIHFVQGKLNIGEVVAIPVIKSVKQNMLPDQLTIIDAPPGTSCPMIEAVKDSNFCILVTEPTPFGLYDLRLAVKVSIKLNIPCGVIINRSDSKDEIIESYCQQNSIPILLKIPFKRAIATAYSEGVNIVDAFPEYKECFRKVLASIQERL